MKYFALLIVLSGLTTTYVKSQNDTAWVFFEKDGKRIELDSNFKILFIYPQAPANIYYIPKIVSNYFILPDLMNGDSSHVILFKYGQSVVLSSLRKINYTENLRLEFIYDEKPFDDRVRNNDVKEEEEKHMNEEEYQIHLVLEIIYEHEGACAGISICSYIENIEDYKMHVRSLLDFMDDE